MAFLRGLLFFLCLPVLASLADPNSYVWYLFPKAGDRLYGHRQIDKQSFESNHLPNGSFISNEEGVNSVWIPADKQIVLGDFAHQCLSSDCDNFTVSFLFKINETLNENETVHFVQQATSGGSGSAFHRLQSSISHNGSANNLQATYQLGSAITETVCNLGEMLNTWSHVALFYQGPGLLYVYINGTNCTHSLSFKTTMEFLPKSNLTLGSDASSHGLFLSYLKIFPDVANESDAEVIRDESWREAQTPTQALVAFNQSRREFLESAGSAEFVINREGNLAVASVIKLILSNDSAVPSDVVLIVSQSDDIFFKPGETIKRFTFTINPDTIPEQNVYFNLTLSSDDSVTNVTAEMLQLVIKDDDIDDCASNPCQNEGNCTDLVADYNCTCVPGFTGKNCSINIDDCAGDPCQNKGNCTDLVADYNCTCVPGFLGKNCSININDCVSDPCQNEGNCTDLVADYNCTCVPGFTGKNCSINIDDCASNPCQNEGNCTDLVADYNCTCVPGFTGKNCSINIDDCASNPCQNEGNCTDLVADYNCTCVPGFTGKNCSINIDDCAGDPCQNKGNCTDLVADYNCTCVPGFLGKNCSITPYLWYLFPIGLRKIYGYEPETNSSFSSDQVPDDSSVMRKQEIRSLHISPGKEVVLGDFANSCLEDIATCNSFTISFLVYVKGPIDDSGNDVKVLHSKPSSDGPYQVDFTVKKVTPLQPQAHVFVVGHNSSELLEIRGDFTGADQWVHVAIVYSSGKVDLHINSVMVTNSITVHNWMNSGARGLKLALGSSDNVNDIFLSYFQIVKGNLSGHEIERIETESRSEARSPGAAEVELVQSNFVYSEDASEFGIPLQRRGNLFIASVLSLSFKNGTAVPYVDFTLFSEELVFKPGDETLSITVQLVDDTTPEVDESFDLRIASADNITNFAEDVHVTIMDNDMDDCDPDPCLNGSICTDLHLDYNCSCAPGFTGKNCSEDINECSNNPCLNGTCNNLISDYSCNCDTGFTGRNCDMDIDDCAGDPCKNDGVCNDLLNDFDCSCSPGYIGKTCSQATQLWYLFPIGNGSIYGYDVQAQQLFTSKELSSDINDKIKEQVRGLCIPKESEVVLGNFANECFKDPSVCENFTISFLVYVNGSLDSGEYVDVLHSTPVSQGNYHVQFTVTRTLAGLEGQAFIVGGNSSTLLERRGTFPGLNQWVHVAIVFMKSPENIELYMNSMKVTGALFTRQWNNSGIEVEFSLGSTNDANYFCVSYLQVIKSGLPDEEIKQLDMESRAQGTDPSGVHARFSSASISVNEGEGFALPSVERTGNLLIASVLRLSTADGTARLSSDYLGLPNHELVIPPGQISREIKIEIEDDTTPESTESFDLFLSPEDGVTLISDGNVTTIQILDDDTDECQELVPCMNQATCLDRHLDYDCICMDGYTGKNCSMSIDDCVGSPCQNNGTCKDLLNDFNCTCAPGYKGKNCSEDIDECTELGNPCQNDGECTDGVNDYVCSCSTGFEGKNCTQASAQTQTTDDDDDEKFRILLWAAIAILAVTFVAIILTVVLLCYLFRNKKTGQRRL